VLFVILAELDGQKSHLQINRIPCDGEREVGCNIL